MLSRLVIVSSLKRANKSCGPPAASKMLSRLVIVSSLKRANKSCGPPAASKMLSRLVIVSSLKRANKSCGPPAASKMLSHFVEPRGVSPAYRRQKKSPASAVRGIVFGGERGIRTLETLLTLTHFPGVLLKPLGHLSVNFCRFLNYQLVSSAACFLRQLSLQQLVFYSGFRGSQLYTTNPAKAMSTQFSGDIPDPVLD